MIKEDVFIGSLIDEYTKDELQQIILNSHSMKEVVGKLGYSTISGNNSLTVKNRLIQYNISTEHFAYKTPTERSESNIFCENSTACQSTLRRWYKNGKYSEYKCSICGQEPIWQGKELTLILDHINGKNHDNRLENLRWVCPNCNQQLDTTGFKKMRTEDKLKKKYYCIDCGKEIYKGSKRCVECSYIDRRKVDRPTKEELLSLIKIKSLSEIGELYGVVENTVRKWCKKYGLPYRKDDIKALLD